MDIHNLHSSPNIATAAFDGGHCNVWNMQHEWRKREIHCVYKTPLEAYIQGKVWLSSCVEVSNIHTWQ